VKINKRSAHGPFLKNEALQKKAPPQGEAFFEPSSDAAQLNLAVCRRW
jgi:hypothetical protein